MTDAQSTMNSPAANPLQRITRLAPSPTGALHLGNARTFLINWAMARANGWKIILRIEDLDGPRIKAGAAQQAIEDLQWLGIDWDTGPFYQRPDLDLYAAALSRLSNAGLAYGCSCTRRDLQTALSAPHADEHDLRYPGTCRGRSWSVTDLQGQPMAGRLVVDPGSIAFHDEIAGPQRIDVQAQTGDFAIWTKAGLPAYQMAVVMDDDRQGVTDVVRGDDLIPSTARQILVYQALEAVGLRQKGKPLPRWWHLPLVVGEDGRRLAKRHGDSRIAWYRSQGVSAERIIGLIASWSGVISAPFPMSAAEFRDRLDLSRLPLGPVVFTTEMHQWLLSFIP